jgi:xanthine dehydrogenase small subunit
MRDHLTIHLNGRPIEVRGCDAFVTLSDFVRKFNRLTGTKVVCAEGDCGACAVLVGRVSDEGNSIDYRTVASCIATMFQLDGAHVITVEGLSKTGTLNPIQESMVKCHGAQCGFCTPGFVVSLYDLMQSGVPLNANGVRRGLVGNLCRCTGYDSIIRSAMETDRSRLETVEVLYPAGTLLPWMNAACGEDVQIEVPDATFFKPVTIASAVRFLSQHPSCLIISGATDLGVQRNKGLRQFNLVMSTAGLKPLRQIAVDGSAITAGATVTLSELERATAEHIPEFSHFLAYFGSPMIKNAGTLAGNLVNASPIGDSIPALMVLGAEVEPTSDGGTRWVPLSQFYVGYRKTVLQSGELLTRVRIPIPDREVIFKLFKVSKRKDLDISSVSAAIWMTEANDKIKEIRIAFGGVGPTVVRLPQVEASLIGKPTTLETFENAGAMAGRTVKPLTDVRGSDLYRRQLVENLLVKFWHERGSTGAARPQPVTNPSPNGHNGDMGNERAEEPDAEEINSMMNR